MAAYILKVIKLRVDLLCLFKGNYNKDKSYFKGHPTAVFKYYVAEDPMCFLKAWMKNDPF